MRERLMHALDAALSTLEHCDRQLAGRIDLVGKAVTSVAIVLFLLLLLPVWIAPAIVAFVRNRS
jgi:hypothetical protein